MKQKFSNYWLAKKGLASARLGSLHLTCPCIFQKQNPTAFYLLIIHLHFDRSTLFFHIYPTPFLHSISFLLRPWRMTNTCKDHLTVIQVQVINASLISPGHWILHKSIRKVSGITWLSSIKGTLPTCNPHYSKVLRWCWVIGWTWQSQGSFPASIQFCDFTGVV